MTAALTLQDVSINFGGIRALEGVSCEVPDGQLRGIIGPNGSGEDDPSQRHLAHLPPSARGRSASSTTTSPAGRTTRWPATG